jgi:hypothetical protein
MEIAKIKPKFWKEIEKAIQKFKSKESRETIRKAKIEIEIETIIKLK